jgi:hypothetical protein
MYNFKTTNIKGKPYVEVVERLKYFRTNFADHSLTTEVVQLTPDFCVLNAIISDASGRVVATGMAQEDRGSSPINKTSYVENCETSAWGRALANFGIGLETSVASAEEVQAALDQEKYLTDIRVKYGQLLMQKVSDANERYRLEARDNWTADKYESGIKYLLTL